MIVNSRHILHVPHIQLADELFLAKHPLTMPDFVAVHPLAEQPWPSFTYIPDVRFSIAHTGDYIVLTFYVEETEVRHVHTAINSSVWEDSCVEFFVGFDHTGYYNFEFNCIGTALVGFGKGRNDRTLLPVRLIERILCLSHMEKKANSIAWQMQAIIPVSLFMHHNVASLEGQICKANFYKCGDLLTQPHFLTWNRIETEHADFHQPAFFGDIVFDEKR